MRDPPHSLWRHPDFLKFWLAGVISGFGDQVTLVALPLLAIITLEANAAQMGILRAAGRAPFLLFGLFIGAWLDRRRRRPVMIGADLGRGLLIGSIFLLALLGALRMDYLYAVAFLAGVLTVCYDVAAQSFLPALVGRERLVEANSKGSMVRSVAQIAGPGVAGVLVQLLSAPVALVADALSFAVSALGIGLLRTLEPAPAPRDGRRKLWGQIGEGWRVVLGSPLLRANTGCRATYVFSTSLLFAVYLLHLARELHLAPAVIGLILAAGGPASLLGAALAEPLARRFGLGRVMIATSALAGAGNLLIPLATGPPWAVVSTLMAAGAISACCGLIYDLHQVTLRQAITPAGLLGRMTATARFLILGMAPPGALAGGYLGGAIGLRPTLLAGALGSTLAVLWLVYSPVRTLRELPQPAE